MAYSQYSKSIKDSNSTFSSLYSAIRAIDITSSWEGDAASKQNSNLYDLLSNMITQSKQVNSLANALALLDEYDKQKELVESYSSTINGLNTKAKDYKDQYSYYKGLRDSASTAKSDLAQKIEGYLSNISSKYSETYTDISPASVIATNDMFKTIGELSTNIDSCLNMNNTVVSFSPITKENMYPNWDNKEAWITKNPFAGANTGQCTWFAWGRFYEIYGYSPGFAAHGKYCAGQLIKAHPDKFYESDKPVPGAIFSQGRNETYGHVGLVLDVDYENNTITIQDGNKNGSSDSFAVAQNDWGTATYPLDEWCAKRGGAIFACPR